MIINDQDLINIIRQVVREEIERVKEKEQYLTTREVCDRLKISRPTLHRWREEGIIKAYKVGGIVRFSDKEIERVHLNNQI